MVLLLIVAFFREIYRFVIATHYEIVYGIMGMQALYDDFKLKKFNKLELTKLPGRVAVVTGGSRGIGEDVVKLLGECDLKIIIGCRNVNAGMMLRKKLLDENSNIQPIDVFELDLERFDSVRSFAKQVSSKYERIHYLVNNAGIMFGPYRETSDGYESQLQVNYLGHFLLTHLLLPNLVRGFREGNGHSRIVNVTSCAHLKGSIDFEDINMKNFYIPTKAYSQSKLAQVLFTNYLNKMLVEKTIGVQVMSVHPGIVDTDLFNNTPIKKVFPWLPGLIFKKRIEGAYPIIYATISKNLERRGGIYINNCQVDYGTNPLADDADLQKRLFDFSSKLLNIESFWVVKI